MVKPVTFGKGDAALTLFYKNFFIEQNRSTGMATIYCSTQRAAEQICHMPDRNDDSTAIVPLSLGEARRYFLSSPKRIVVQVDSIDIGFGEGGNRKKAQTPVYMVYDSRKKNDQRVIGTFSDVLLAFFDKSKSDRFVTTEGLKQTWFVNEGAPLTLDTVDAIQPDERPSDGLVLARELEDLRLRAATQAHGL